jgi:hypothetical protein
MYTAEHNTLIIVKIHCTGDMFRLKNSHHQVCVNVQTITDHCVLFVCDTYCWLTASTLTTFYDQVFNNNNNKCHIQTERSDEWSFERLRRPDDGYF